MLRAVSFLLIAAAACCLACKPVGDSNEVTIGSTTHVCVMIGPLDWNATGKYIQVATTVSADELSSVEISDCEYVLQMTPMEIVYLKFLIKSSSFTSLGLFDI